MIARETLAGPKATWVGGIPQVSSESSKALMSRSNIKRAPLHPFGRCSVEAMV